ncbi:hypothetical protein SAMN02745945_02940 [Peptoclostridium litorale DSM 5388]|uniref:Uncharacterized protein n=1 Tax=Peptoclostridium litorale DSM 5388 TaxID=1121324 RepID=A0A069RIE7_PEPLI|nr:hypothetical protein [Peptoclostridium litorale]KDR96799.1 hypothetical protein CLIT_20p00120 [Peptoclostridium litorale DSM 5388]SIO36267.1 hypothetical protein SAMN02745945_02940 [Peptoclostridium litorale DSM 5388]
MKKQIKAILPFTVTLINLTIVMFIWHYDIPNDASVQFRRFIINFQIGYGIFSILPAIYGVFSSKGQLEPDMKLQRFTFLANSIYIIMYVIYVTYVYKSFG